MNMHPTSILQSQSTWLKYLPKLLTEHLLQLHTELIQHPSQCHTQQGNAVGPWRMTVFCTGGFESMIQNE